MRLLLLILTTTFLSASPSLEDAWKNPPQKAKLRAYWWWLNGNVTKESITSDLEAMKEKGFGGAVIFDADGSSQSGNAPVPAGPTFGSPEWRELYKHTIREADRLGLTLSLNIQSGWNLGGPSVKPEEAAKLTVWSETNVAGNSDFHEKLPLPTNGFYRDAFVVAWEKPSSSSSAPKITAHSSLRSHSPALAIDGKNDTFWVSSGQKPGEGPSSDRPEWLQLDFPKPVTATGLRFTPRSGYGPRDGEVQVSENGKDFRKIASFSSQNDGETKITFPETTASQFRLVITNAYDSGNSSSRNVQIAEINLIGPANFMAAGKQSLDSSADKALLSSLPGSAPDLSGLLTSLPNQPGDNPIAPDRIIDLTLKMDAEGTLSWKVPQGEWTVMRFGYTIGPRAHVSTASGDWKGYALDVLDANAFRTYWDQVVAPLIKDAGPLIGKTLKYLHTDSWEIEPINWTASFPEEFQKRRGYPIQRWLPVIAGHIVDNRDASTRFLNDFRKTLGELAFDNHYKPFKELAHAAGLEIHPESGGPHVVPIDAQQCLGFSDVPMSEFWATSWKHRVGDANRFFVKQPASAAHTYGRPLVMAEGFTPSVRTGRSDSGTISSRPSTKL